MPYLVPTFEDIRNCYLRDVKNLRPDAAVHPDSDTFIRASATSSAVDGLYHYQSWIARQVLPDTADPENIEYHAALRGLSKKPATAAEGVVTLAITGKEGLPFTQGLQIVHKDSGDVFVTTQNWQPEASAGATTITLPVIAKRKGVMPVYTNEPVTLQAPPPGISGQALLSISGGTNEESHAELLARLLFYMRNPPGGGTKTDYERWALEEPGIANAICFPGRRGLGTVDVLVWGENTLATEDAIKKAQQRIEKKRPVACKDCLVLSPVLSSVDITARVKLHAGTLVTLFPLAKEALTRFFQQTSPGKRLPHAALAAAIMGLPYVADVVLESPDASISPKEITWLRLGNIELRGW